jgi:hypothetical protein
MTGIVAKSYFSAMILLSGNFSRKSFSLTLSKQLWKETGNRHAYYWAAVVRIGRTTNRDWADDKSGLGGSRRDWAAVVRIGRQSSGLGGSRRHWAAVVGIGRQSSGLGGSRRDWAAVVVIGRQSSSLGGSRRHWAAVVVIGRLSNSRPIEKSTPNPAPGAA